MVFKNAEALQTLIVLQRVNETGKLGFVIAKNRRKFADELREYVEARDKIIRQHGVLRTGENNVYSLPPEYEQELKDLDEMDCEIAVAQIDEEAFCSGTLTTNDMYVLDWMVKDNEDERVYI